MINRRLLYVSLAVLVSLSSALQIYAAEAVVIGREQQYLLPHGKEVDAILGDYLLRSDKIALVIGGVAAFRDANVNTQCVQGAVIDLTRLDLPGGDNDLLTAYYPHGHYLDAPGSTRAEIVRARGTEVVVRFSRAATPQMQGEPVDVTTEYTLRDGDPFVRIKTTYTNRASKPVNAAVYDKIRADTLFRIPPAGVTSSLIYYEPWTRGAYGVVRASGAPIQSYANPAKKTYFEEGGNRLDFPDLMTAKDLKPLSATLPVPSPIAAGEFLTVERYLIPGRHTADVQAVVSALLKEQRRIVPVKVVDDEGKPLAKATVLALRGATTISEGWTDDRGQVALVVDSDPVDIVVKLLGRADVNLAAVNSASPITVKTGAAASVSFDITAQGAKQPRVPVKVVLHGINGTPDPDFGPDAMASFAGNLCFSRDGLITTPLPPGEYEALIGHGPEYTQESRTFKVAYGQATSVKAQIRKAFESPGWIIADFHNHTTNSNDSIADPEGRVVGIAAAGVEFAPATEHNRISSFAQYIERQKLTPFLHSAGGIELSGRPGPGALNHQNAFPLRVQDGMQGGGAPQTHKDPKVQISRLFEYDSAAEKFIQHNHPDVGWLYFDKDRDGKIDGGFGTRPYTNAMEINREVVKILPFLESTSKTTSKLRGRGFDWLQMLNQGDRIYGTGTSDAHVTAHNDGSIFTYLKSEVDDPAQFDALKLARAAKAGQMVISNGPFLEVTLNNTLPGGEVRANGPSELYVRVHCNPSIDIDRVQVLVNGRPEPTLNFTRKSAPESFRNGADALRFERRIPLQLAKDSHVIVITTGEAFRLGPFYGPYAAHRPTALSNPIFVDVDGGGFLANKDTLGMPLPMALPKAASGTE